jgi:hypothetical protein
MPADTAAPADSLAQFSENPSQRHPINLRVSINRLYPGQKLRRKDEGETRWDVFNKAFHPEIHMPESLLDEIAVGHSFCAVMSSYRNSDNFVSSQTLALDYDSGNLSIDELMADDFIANHASFIYSTLSHTEDNRKWRIVFVTTERISDHEVYRKAMTALLDRYEMTDQAIKDPARFLYGSNPHTGTHKFLVRIHR